MPKWSEYTSKDKLADNDEVMLYDATARANKRGLMSKFWDYVVDKMATAVISKLETDNKTIIGAINALNSESLILNNLLFYRSSGANIKSITISVNKDANRAFRYAPFIIFGHSSFLTGVTYSINSTNKVGDILTEYSFDDSSEKVTFSNLGEFPNIVIIIYYQNISKAKIEEK